MSNLPRLCMFCSQEIGSAELTMEHFVPKCLWEKGHRPAKMRTVPAHKSCNASFSEDNEYFRNVLILERGAAQKCEGAKTVAENTIDRMIEERPGVIVAAARNLCDRPVTTASGLCIGIEPSFEVDASRIQRVLFNVMKGIYFTTQKLPMPPDCELEVYDTDHLDGAPYRRTVESMVDWQSFGDDVFCCRYRFFGAPATGMVCLMRFYNNRMFYGAALSPQMIEKERNRDAFIPSRPNSPILIPRHHAE